MSAAFTNMWLLRADLRFPLHPKLTVLPPQPGQLRGQIRRRRGRRLRCGSPRRSRHLHPELRHPSTKHRLLQPPLSGHRAGTQPAVGDPINGLPLERFRKHPALNTHQTRLSSSEKLAWVSTETREDHCVIGQKMSAQDQGVTSRYRDR
jgi:hypothetical protein